jgi:2-methylcitrate dehydratase PrpD
VKRLLTLCSRQDVLSFEKCRKEMIMGETEILADYATRARFEDLPEEVVNHTKESVSDTIACGLGGRKTLEGDVLIEIMKEMDGKPEATVIGDKTKLSFMHAAQVNRVLTNMIDYDDTLLKVGHMSTVLVPVALAVGEQVNASGKDIINALVTGYEVIIHIREAVNPSEETFWKTFERIDSGIHLGVTVVAGKLLGLNSEQMADAFGLTGHVRAWRITRPDWARKGMPRWMKVTGGDITIPGIHAVLLAKKGFPGDRTILDQGRGYEKSVGSDRYDGTKLIRNLGREYGMLRIGYKFYSACRHTSTTLDAVAAIAQENGIKAEDVEQVIVRVQKMVAENFAIYEPEYMIQAQFSIPYVVTMILMGEPTGPNWYSGEKLKNPNVREFQHKVKLEEDPMCTKKFYAEHKSSSTVEIKTTNGRRFKKYVESPKGDPENPFTEQDHINKLTNMASWLGMRQSQIKELIQRLDRLEELGDISELTCLLVP